MKPTLSLLFAFGLLAGCPTANDDDSAANDDDSAVGDDDDSVSDDDDSVGDDDDSVGDDDDSSSTGDDDDDTPTPDLGIFSVEGSTSFELSNVLATDGYAQFRAGFGAGGYYDLTVSWPPGALTTGDCVSVDLQVSATFSSGGTSLSGAQTPGDCSISQASWGDGRLSLDVQGELWDANQERDFTLQMDVAQTPTGR